MKLGNGLRKKIKLVICSSAIIHGLSSSNPVFLDPMIDGVEPRIHASMNDDLDKPFEASEV